MFRSRVHVYYILAAHPYVFNDTLHKDTNFLTANEAAEPY